jgi:hypothetical protein
MKTADNLIQWMPRILCVVAIFFVSMFATDAFAPGLTIGEQLRDFILHLIPSFILLGFLIIAWKWEWVGGLLFILIGLGFGPFIFLHNFDMNHSFWMSMSIVMMINFPFILVGILFLVSYYRKKKNLPLA